MQRFLGHRDVVKTHKTCPNFNVKEWWKQANKEYKNDFSKNSLLLNLILPN